MTLFTLSFPFFGGWGVSVRLIELTRKEEMTHILNKSLQGIFALLRMTYTCESKGLVKYLDQLPDQLPCPECRVPRYNDVRISRYLSLTSTCTHVKASRLPVTESVIEKLSFRPACSLSNPGISTPKFYICIAEYYSTKTSPLSRQFCILQSNIIPQSYTIYVVFSVILDPV